VAPGGVTGSSAVAGSTGDDPYTTYCLMWPTQQGAWGLDWQQQQQQGVLAMDVPARDPVYCSSAAAAATTDGEDSAGHLQPQQQQQQRQRQLPEWLYGLHSWRYGDGPEWIKPAAAAAAGDANGSTNPPAVQSQQPASRSAVIWVTGRAAQQMAALSDKQVLQDLALLLQTYPAIPRPDSPAVGSSGGSNGSSAVGGQGQTSLQECTLLRSTWTSSPYFRGSYSYPSPQADGSTADALAAPLTAAEAVLHMAAGTEPDQSGGVESGAGNDGVERGAGRGADSSSSSGRVLVCFAGEATSRVHMGTVHGAFNSGVREAQRLLHSWGFVQPAAAGAAVDAGESTAPAEYHAAFWL
jgi:hypothetical protein